MQEQETTRLVQQAYQNFKTGDIPALLNLLTDEVQWHLPDIENVPFSGRRQGRAKVAEFFSLLASQQEVLQFEPREFVAQGDKVVALGYYWWRAKATGREYGGDFAHVFTVQDGRVSHFHEYMDTAAAAHAHATT
ncbi:MAG: nuclear transport factor 2 family protein [Abitibacteriaceae bacterium]|nr:nuclear transport factor 2 family protein [Abditibacteriaceae bacterium]